MECTVAQTHARVMHERAMVRKPAAALPPGPAEMDTLVSRPRVPNGRRPVSIGDRATARMTRVCKTPHMS